VLLILCTLLGLLREFSAAIAKLPEPLRED
jgi:hypothetical protein